MQNRYLAVPMETRGVVAWWDPVRRSFDIWVSTQSPHDVRTVTARITGVAEQQIRVQMGDVGGGFGQKAYLARDEQIVILASYHLARPLKWIEDRRENLVAATSTAGRALHRLDGRRQCRQFSRRPAGSSRRGRRLPHGGQRSHDGRRHIHRSVPNPEALFQQQSV